MSVDEKFYDAIDLLKAMIEIPSFSREEDALATMLEGYIRKNGHNPLRKGNNVWILSPNFSDSKPTILLNSHIDTVKPVSAWKRNPFTASEEDGCLYGLGSNDAGASLVSLLHTFFLLTEREQQYNLIFLASCEEEISGKGGIELILSELPTPTFGIVGEPTGMNPAIAEKGLMVLDCISHGKSGHSARNEGDNAIYRAMKDIEWFRTFQFPKTSESLGPVKMSVTMINSGTQHNVVPDRCEFVVDVRTTDAYTNAEVLAIIDQQTDCEVKARSTRLNSSGISLDNPFIQRAIMVDKKPYGSPTLSDQALMPFPTVKIGPGESARSHTADEYIMLEEIREAIELYYKFLNGLSL